MAADCPQRRTAFALPGQHLRSGVGAAVVNHKDFVCDPPGQHGGDFIQQRREAFPLVQDRDDDGKLHAITLQQVGCKPSSQTTRYDFPGPTYARTLPVERHLP